MGNWLRRRRGSVSYDQIVKDVAPTVSTSKELLRVCQTQESSSAVLEAGIAKLFAVHRAVLAATGDENVRQAVLSKVHERFVFNFVQAAREAGLSKRELVEHTVRRLATYDAIMDANIPQWQSKLSQEVYENITRQRPDTTIALVIGIPILEEMNATAEFLRNMLA